MRGKAGVDTLSARRRGGGIGGALGAGRPGRARRMALRRGGGPVIGGVMVTTLVLTVVGPDRPGLVEAVATQVAENGGNWLESRMSHLGGQFAGILRIEVAAERAEALREALAALEGRGLVVTVTPAGEAVAPTGTPAVIEVVGQDRPGILRAVSRVLAGHGVNVEDLTSERASAPMGGGTVFKARAQVLVPDGLKLPRLRAELENLADDLLVDVSL